MHPFFLVPKSNAFLIRNLQRQVDTACPSRPNGFSASSAVTSTAVTSTNRASTTAQPLNVSTAITTQQVILDFCSKPIGNRLDSLYSLWAKRYIYKRYGGVSGEREWWSEVSYLNLTTVIWPMCEPPAKGSPRRRSWALLVWVLDWDKCRLVIYKCRSDWKL